MSGARAEIDPELAWALSEIRRNAIAAAPPAWPGLASVLDRALAQPLTHHSVLPLAITRAAGGRLADGVPFGVVWTLTGLAVRVLDDCADEDDPNALHRQLGLGRAINYACALIPLSLQLLNALPDTMGARELLDEYTATYMRAAAGQDRDVAGGMQDVEAYVRLVEDKTCAGFAFAGFGAAMAARPSRAVLEACRRIGYHVGMALQLIDDLESAWRHDGDLSLGKRTFPIWHGLARDGRAATELRTIVFGPEPQLQADRIRLLLAELDVPRSVLTAAAEERRLAEVEIAKCPDAAGRRLVQTYLDFVLSRATELIAPPTRGARRS